MDDKLVLLEIFKMKNKMKKPLLILITTMIMFFNSCNSDNSLNRPKTAEELKLELKIQEQSSPTKYLTINNATMKHNLIRESGLFHDAEYDGWLVQGTINNSASVAKFKDIVVGIKLISKTLTVIEEKDYVIYEFYEPNSSKEFSIKIYPPKPTDTFSVIVKRATATQ